MGYHDPDRTRAVPSIPGAKSDADPRVARLFTYQARLRPSAPGCREARRAPNESRGERVGAAAAAAGERRALLVVIDDALRTPARPAMYSATPCASKWWT